jgi:hypothetical protein
MLIILRPKTPQTMRRITCGVQKIGIRMCVAHRREFKVSEKKKDLVICVALTAHHIPNSMSCNTNTSINVGVSVN